MATTKFVAKLCLSFNFFLLVFVFVFCLHLGFVGFVWICLRGFVSIVRLGLRNGNVVEIFNFFWSYKWGLVNCVGSVLLRNCWIFYNVFRVQQWWTNRKWICELCVIYWLRWFWYPSLFTMVTGSLEVFCLSKAKWLFVFCLSFAWFFFFDYIFSLHENFTSVYWAFVFNLVLFDRCACVFAFIIVGFNLVGLSIMLKPRFVVISDFRKLVRELWIYKVLFSKRIFIFIFKTV